MYLGFAVECCGFDVPADDKSAVVEGGTVLGQPGTDRVFVGDGEEVGEGAVRGGGADGHGDGGYLE